MGATTEGVEGSPPPPKKKKLDGPPTFYVAFWVGGNRLRQTGYTFLFFGEGQYYPDQEIGHPNFENVLRPR